MTSISNLTHLIQEIMTTVANQLAEETGFTQRQGKITGAQFAQMLVCGALDTPTFDYPDLISLLDDQDITITASSLSERFSDRSVAFMQQLFLHVVQHCLPSDPVPIDLLRQFAAVVIQDSTTIALPKELAAAWPGCGGNHDNAKAALKCHTRLDVLHGGLTLVLTPGHVSDRADVGFPAFDPDTLILRDLGYWKLETLRAEADSGVWWVSRLYAGVGIHLPDGTRTTLEDLLPATIGDHIDQDVILGCTSATQVRARLIAIRVPDTLADAREERIRTQARAKGERASAYQLATARWLISVTNGRREQVTVAGVQTLLRARWQIENLFKLWKSVNGLGKSTGRKPERIMTELYAKLIAVILQHWLMVVLAWTIPNRSPWQMAEVLQQHARALMTALRTRTRLRTWMTKVAHKMGLLPHQRKRPRHPGTHELLCMPMKALHGLGMP